MADGFEASRRSADGFEESKAVSPANFETAPLDFRYSERWDTMAFADQLWAVLSGDIGPSPILAAGVLR